MLGYLKNYGNEKPGGATAIVSSAEQLRRTGQDALQRQHQLLRRSEEIARQLSPLLAERKRQLDANPQVRTVLVKLAAHNEGELRLSYRLAGAGWMPLYRAYLDSATAQVRLERHAQVAQSSGEDWSDVKLRLSTVQPNLASRPNPPQPWTLDIRPPAPTYQVSYAKPALAPAPVVLARPAMAGEDNAADFDVGVFQGEYAAEFAVPGKIKLASDGQRVSFALASQTLDAQILTRVQPQQEAQAYLLADAARPGGSWPAGTLQLFRDGDFVGQSQLRLGNEERLELFFGRDPMLRVELEPERREGANKGFTGSRVEQKIAYRYRFENLHKTPVRLEVLAASPVAQHEDIRVQAQFSPQPTQANWHQQPGVMAWSAPLAAGKTLQISADYLISYPKEAQLSGLR
ncbi:MAG: DUF4139 domain-containing protein [Burkholderiales bacterium]|nr:DUF4139 domain-containing protein [Burkholderiales bacterium]